MREAYFCFERKEGPKLKPCPFCGGEPERFGNGIHCTKCPVNMCQMTSWEAVVEKWNRRVKE